MEFLHDTETWIAVGFLFVIGVMVYKRVPAMLGTHLDKRAAAAKPKPCLPNTSAKPPRRNTRPRPSSARRVPKPNGSRSRPAPD